MNLPNFLCDGFAHFSTMPAWGILLFKATLILTLAWLIHFSLARANPRWRMFLWRGVAVGLVLPALWIFGLPGVKIYIEAPEPVATTAPISVQPVAARHDSKITANNFERPFKTPIDIESTAPFWQTQVEVRPDTSRPAESSALSLPWQSVLLGIWGFGVALFAVRLAMGYLRLGRLLKTSQPASEAVLAEARRIAAALGCRRAVQIRVTRLFSVPFMFGIMRPVLVLPERMCEMSYGPQLPGILAHELAHMRSWDLPWNAGMQFISILLWFHPLAWRIGSAHRAACDVVCDAVSASYLGDVQEYCRTLARVAIEATGTYASVGLAMARGCDVRRRLAALQRKVFALPLKRRSVVGAAIVGLVALTLLAGLRLVLAEAPPKANDDKAVTASEQKTPDDGAISLKEAVRIVNEQAAKTPESRAFKPLTEDEVIKAIDALKRDGSIWDPVYLELKRIAETGRLPKNVILRQFVRYNDGTCVEHGWWVRLMLLHDGSNPFCMTIRQDSVFRRPYTQKERMFKDEVRQTGVFPTMNRLVAYFDDNPKFGTVQEFSKQEVDRLADDVKKAVVDKNADELIKTSYWEKVDNATRAAVRAETEQFVKRRLGSVSVAPKSFGGKLLEWQGLKYWDPNIPVLGYIVLEFADQAEPKSMWLEFGETPEGMRLVNYIVSWDDGPKMVGKPLTKPINVRGFTMINPKDGSLEYCSQIDDSDDFPAFQKMNLEIWKIEHKDKAKPAPAVQYTANPPNRSDSRPMKIQVSDTDGKPVVDADVSAGGMTAINFGPFKYKTNAEGYAKIDVPKEGTKDFQIFVWKSGYISAGAQWFDFNNIVQVPETFSFTLEPGIAIGGLVRDEQGKPITGVEITVDGSKQSLNEIRYNPILDTDTTDVEGKWWVNHVPKELTGFKLTVTLKHPEFGIEHFDVQKLPLDELRAKTASLILHKGVAVEGTVTTPDGKPASDVAVGLMTGNLRRDYQRTKTDENGHYRIMAIEPDEYTVAAAAEGFVPGCKEFTIGKDQQTINLQLGKGELIRLNVVDQAGKPLPEIEVGCVIGEEKNRYMLMLEQENSYKSSPYRKLTDAEGRWSRLWIPNDKMHFLIRKEGFVTLEKSFAPDQREQLITLEAIRKSVSDPVFDQETKPLIRPGL